MAKIVVVGAGVTGLTTAMLLARDGYDVSIVAKHMPGDYDIEYCSPWAGADYSPNLAASQARKNTRHLPPKEAEAIIQQAAEYEQETWPELERLARDVPEAGLHFQESRGLKRINEATRPSAQWYERITADPHGIPPNIRSYIDSAKDIPPSALPPGFDAGLSFRTVGINTALYLPWLASQCLSHGATLRRAVLTHISHAAKLHHSGQSADLVVNCTGLSSLSLGGVEDEAMYPVRGQVVIVRNDPGVIYGATAGTLNAPSGAKDESTYIITRAAGGGTILGGCTQDNRWESQPDMDLSLRIMQRALEVCPTLVEEGKGVAGLSVVRHGVGLRPMRKGGIRIERVEVDGVKVVMNYGHGGGGYQLSYGTARAAKRLVDEVLKPVGNGEGVNGHA